jgi:hypothetical protein
MTHRTDPTNARLGDARLDRMIAEVMAERAEGVYSSALRSRDVAARIAGRPRYLWLRQGALFAARGGLAILALVALLALAMLALLVVGSWLGPRNSQLAVAEQIVESVNARKPETMRSLMTEDGVLEFPAIDMRGGGEGRVYMADRTVSEAFGTPHGWMEILDTYWGGMETHLGSCRSVAAAAITCDVRTRWRTLQIEIGEAWTFEFDGGRVAHLEMLRVDPDPPNRSMPLALADLSAWEAWLRQAHPAQADRLLFDDSNVFGHLYFRYVWTNPQEIGASIREYLATRP